MRHALLPLVLVLAPVLSGAEPPVPAATPRPGISSTLRDVSFMVGRWVDEEKGTLSEEIWSVPGGDSMMGMWRLSVGGKAKVFEFLTMVEEEGRVTFRLRHFDRRGVAWEEKDKPLVLPLVVKGASLAVFEGDGKSGILRLTYRREGEALVGRLEKAGEAPVDYRFRRAPQAAGTGGDKP
jgi:hypothetical protein